MIKRITASKNRLRMVRKQKSLCFFFKKKCFFLASCGTGILQECLYLAGELFGLTRQFAGRIQHLA